MSPFPTVGQTLYGGWTQEGERYADLKTRFSSYNTKAEGLVCDSVVDDAVKFDTLVNTTMQPAGGVLDVVGIPRIASNKTVPKNVRLNFINGAYLAPDVGVTVTINGTFNRSLDKKFGTAGTFQFSRAKVAEIFPQWFGGELDGIVDDTIPMKSSIKALGVGIAKVRVVGKLRLTSHLSAEIDSKESVILVGDNLNGQRGNNVPGPMASVVYLKDLTTYMYTKTGTTNETLAFIGVAFDGANGGGLAGAGTTCPGVVYGNGNNQYRFTMKKSLVTNFGFVHDNNAGTRALVDIKPVFGLIDESELSYCPDGRLLYVQQNSTHLKIRRTELTVAREVYYVNRSDNVVFDHCVFESVTTIGAAFQSAVKHRDCWYENIGFNGGSTGYTSGISLRNHGLVFGAGALSANTSIITPLQQLYGSLNLERPIFKSFATGGINFTPAAWLECLGQVSATAQGGVLSIRGGKKPSNTVLFSSTMAMAATERGTFFHVFVEEGWSTDSGSFGSGLFINGVNDHRKVNSGVGRIWLNDGSVFLATFKGGRLLFDCHDFSSALAAVPGANQYPIGDQWEIGDKIIFPVPVNGGFTGLVCTTAGTAGAVWKNWGATQEEGDWVPVLTFGGAAVGMTYSTQFGKYTRIGRQVNVEMFIQLSAKGSSVGAAVIAGLPFVINNNLGAHSAAGVRGDTVTFTGQLQAFGFRGTQTIWLEKLTEAGVVSQLSDTNFANTTAIMLQLTYQI